MKRFAAILVVAAAFSGVAPVAAIAQPIDCSSPTWPLNMRLVPYC